MKVMKPLIDFLSCAACSSAVFTSAESGTIVRSSPASSSCVTPCFAATEIDVKPWMRSSCCACGIVKTAKVAPPSDSTSPYFATPTTVNACTGPFAATPILSPIRKCSLRAVSGSITTSPGPAAQRPDSSVSGLKRGCEVSTPIPKVGAPAWSIAFPSLPISFALVESPLKSMSEPAAAATSGCVRIRASSAGDTVALPLDE